MSVPTGFQQEPLTADTKLGAALQRAARDLPVGYEVHIKIKQGLGGVELHGPRFVKLMRSGDAMHFDVTEAIDRAIVLAGRRCGESAS